MPGWAWSAQFTCCHFIYTAKAPAREGPRFSHVLNTTWLGSHSAGTCTWSAGSEAHLALCEVPGMWR